MKQQDDMTFGYFSFPLDSKQFVHLKAEHPVITCGKRLSGLFVTPPPAGGDLAWV